MLWKSSVMCNCFNIGGKLYKFRHLFFVLWNVMNLCPVWPGILMML